MTPSSTFVSTLMGVMAGTGQINHCDASTIDGSGNAWVSVETGSDEYLVKFDLATHAITTVGPVTSTYFDALWFDPADGSFHGMLDTGNLATIDPATGVETDTGLVMSPYAYGTVLDNAGNYYANDWSGLWIGATTDYTTATQAPNPYGASATSVMTIFTTTNFWPDSTPVGELPSTGVDTSALAIAAGVAMALLSIGGLALVAVRRRIKI